MLAACFLLTCLTAGVGAQFVAPEGSSYRNGSSLPLEGDSTVSGLLLRLEQALVEGSAEEAAFVVRSLRVRPGIDLVPFGPRTHVPALDRALRLLAERGTAAQRQLVEAELDAVVTQAAEFRDLSALEQLAASLSASAAGTRAQRLGAQLAFERGDSWVAAALAARAAATDAAPGIAAGAEALRLAALESLPAPAPAPPDGPWTLRFSFRRPLDEDHVGLPLFCDGRPGEALVLDAWGLTGLDLGRSVFALVPTFGSFLFGPRVLGPAHTLRAVPAPREFACARSGLRLVIPYDLPADDRDPRRRSERAARAGRLLAIDLLDAGPQLAWQARPLEAPGSVSVGPPTVAGDRVFVQVFRVREDTEVSLAAFALDDGRLLFETPLVRGTFIPRRASRHSEFDVDRLDKRAREGPPAVRDGMVWCCTGYGVVAAVDGLSGRPLLTFHYDRLASDDRGAFTPAQLFDTWGWQDEPVRLARERVVVAPSDSRFLYMLAFEPGERGHLMREDPIERLDREYLVGLVEPPQAGAPSVLATCRRDNRTGLVLIAPGGHVSARSLPLPADAPGLGRPLALGSQVLLPTARGLALFATDALDQPPRWLVAPEGLPPVRAVQAVQAGLLALCPRVSRASGTPDELLVLYWQADP